MSNYNKWLKRIAKAIKNDRFSFAYGERDWYGYKISVGPLFCSYGKIGYTIDIYEMPMCNIGHLVYDYEMQTLILDDTINLFDTTDMKKTIKNLIKIAEKQDWKVSVDGNDYDFSKYSDYGQDFHVLLTAKSADKLVAELDRFVQNFDISEEAYLWLDSSGHGQNGAPYEMVDVYKDMEDCKEMAEGLLNHWNYLN